MILYEEILRLRLTHDYFGDEALPIRVSPADPRAFDRHGLILRQQGKEALVVAEVGAEDLPDQFELALWPDAQDVMQATLGANWSHVPTLDAPFGQDDITFQGDTPKNAPLQQPQKQLCHLSIARAETGLREVDLRFDAVEALWSYHVVGGETAKDLAVVDANEAIQFEPLGTETMPDTRVARVIRSTSPIRARARPDQRFSLQEPGPFGPKTLVPVLPAAGISFKPSTGAQPAHPFQADIYITLN